MARAVLEQRLIGGVTAILLLFITVLAVLAVAGLAGAVARALRRRQQDDYDGPDSLLLMEEIDAHLDGHATADRDLNTSFGIGAPKPHAKQLEEQ